MEANGKDEGHEDDQEEMIEEEFEEPVEIEEEQ
jgi:hypothetical protein